MTKIVKGSGGGGVHSVVVFFLGAKNVWLTKLKIRKERGVSGKKKGEKRKKKLSEILNREM